MDKDLKREKELEQMATLTYQPERESVVVVLDNETDDNSESTSEPE